MLSIDADWIEGFSDYKLSYNPDGADRTKTITLDKSIAVVYNGKFTDMFTE